MDVDRDKVPWKTEWDVIYYLKKLGHDVYPLGVDENLKVIRDAVKEFKPQFVFNLLEEFAGEAFLDQNVVSYLELLKLPYSGSNPRGLMLARDKALAKKILTYHKIKSPKFFVFPKNKNVKKPKNLNYPLIVKCLNEEASLGIAQASIVHNDETLKERIEYINKKLQVDAIAEEFIEGREFYVGIYGNYRLTALPVWELFFENSDNPGKEIFSSRAKFNLEYQKRKGIDAYKAEIDEDTEKRIQEIAKRTYRVLNLSGYGRIDMRMKANGQIHVLEANPNPCIAYDDEFAMSAKYAKLSYPELLSKIISLGHSWYDHY
ncbi:MAG: ATP-grasp domain-containing protein [Halobacteriovoraceae bacterium]|nr:ATP-grasp domain-containing protein [Halobacteriovoraceae bacterium]